jgi:hypothetical protein
MSDTAQIVRKYLVVSFILPLVLGCASMQGPNLHPNLPQRDNVKTPYTEFVGDEISIGLVAYANHELWKCTDCASGATSGQLLAALPLAIAKKPDLVHILTGSYDVDDPTWNAAWNLGASDPNLLTCQNIRSMMAQLTAANIPFIVGNIPSWEAGTLSNTLAETVPQGVLGVQANELLFNLHLGLSLGSSPGEDTTIPIIDYYSAVPADDISDNGIDPNAQGYAVMLTLAQAAINQTHAGELR